MGGKQKRKGSNGGPRPSKSRAALWLQKKTREAEERAETRNNQRRLDRLVQESRRRRASSASDASDTSDSETDEERSEKKKRRARRRAKRRKRGDRIIEVNLDALAPTHVAEGFHVIIQVMPKAPEAPEVALEPEAEAAVAEQAGEQEGAQKVDPQGNYSDAEILEWMRIELTHADRIRRSFKEPVFRTPPSTRLHPQAALSHIYEWARISRPKRAPHSPAAAMTPAFGTRITRKQQYQFPC